MIFNDKPFYNEPGYEYLSDDKRVEQYNRTIEQRTVDHAIVHWLTDRLANPDSKLAAAGSSTSAVRGVKPSIQGAAGGHASLSTSTAGPSQWPNTPPAAYLANSVASQSHPGNNQPKTQDHPAGSKIAQVHKESLAPTQAHPAKKTTTQSHQASLTLSTVPQSNTMTAQGYQEMPALPQGLPPHPTLHDLLSADLVLLEALIHSEPGSVSVPGSVFAMDHHQASTGQWAPATPVQPAAASTAANPPVSPPVPASITNATHFIHAPEPWKPPSRPAQAPQASPKEDDPIWGEVIRKHFELKGKQIVETVSQWEKRAPTGDMLGAGDRVMAQLTRHGFVH
jgi:baculoviral IAP repeat-containing protein 6